MAKSKKRKGPAFFQLFHYMLKSEAWQSLTPHARTIYIEIAGKHNGYNNGDLSFTYKEAERIMHKKTFNRVIGELVEKGFIDVVRSGGLNKKCNLFALSSRWKHYGTPHFEQGKRHPSEPKQ